MPQKRRQKRLEQAQLKHEVKPREQRKLRIKYYSLKNTAGFGGIGDLVEQVSGKTKGEKINKVKNWLLSQESYALHYPIKKKYPRQKISVSGIHEQWEADLMFIPFRSKREHRPVLEVIDSFSKRGDCRILKDKTPQSVCSAL